MEPYWETDNEFIEGLFPCEEQFLYDLVESGSTWENAKKLLVKQNEKFGTPVHVGDWKAPNGMISKLFDWKVPEPEPEPEPEE